MKEQDLNEQQKAEQTSSDKSNETTPIYLTRNDTLQTPEEARRDKNNDPRFDDEISLQDHNRFPADKDQEKQG